MNFTLGDLVNLFLAGYDDKVYIDLQYNEFEVIYEDIRIINNKLRYYKDCKIYALYEVGGRLVVSIERRQ